MITGGSGRFGATGAGAFGTSVFSVAFVGGDSGAFWFFSPINRLASLFFSVSRSFFSALTPFSPHWICLLYTSPSPRD